MEPVGYLILTTNSTILIFDFFVLVLLRGDTRGYHRAFKINPFKTQFNFNRLDCLARIFNLSTLQHILNKIMSFS